MPSRTLVALRVNASPERAFHVFTREIALWWRPNGLFSFTRYDTGGLAFEPHEGGAFTQTLANGDVFEIGRISVWQPPTRLVFSWRPESFAPEQSTEVHVSFEAVGEQTRVVVEHYGWDSIPQEHVARHTFPLPVFQQSLAEWWQILLASLKERSEASP